MRWVYSTWDVKCVRRTLCKYAVLLFDSLFIMFTCFLVHFSRSQYSIYDSEGTESSCPCLNFDFKKKKKNTQKWLSLAYNKLQLACHQPQSRFIMNVSHSKEQHSPVCFISFHMIIAESENMNNIAINYKQLNCSQRLLFWVCTLWYHDVTTFPL